MENPIAENPNMENPITGNRVLNFKSKATAKAKAPAASSETSLFDQATAIAVVTGVSDTRAVSVTLNDISYPVTHYLSTLPGIVPSVKLGDQVLISAVPGEDGVMIHGIMMLYADKPSRSSISMHDGKLVIEAQGAVILKCASSTIELTEAGEIRLNGRDVRTVADTVHTEGKDITTLAKETLTLFGGKVDVN